MKLILVILLCMIPFDALSQQKININSSNQELILKIHSNYCYYNEQCVISASIIKNALPEYFSNIDLIKDFNIVSFSSWNGIRIRYNFDKNEIRYIMPDLEQYNKFGEKASPMTIDGKQMGYVDTGDQVYGIIKPHIIKGFLKGIPITIYFNIYWYEAVG